MHKGHLLGFLMDIALSASPKLNLIRLVIGVNDMIRVLPEWVARKYAGSVSKRLTILILGSGNRRRDKFCFRIWEHTIMQNFR